MVEANSITTTSFNPAKLSDRSLDIISFIFENGGATTSELVKRVQEKWGALKNTTVRHVYNLRNYGLITKFFRTWILTEKGVEVYELFCLEQRIKEHYKKQSMYQVVGKLHQVTYSYSKLHTINNIIENNGNNNNKTNQILHIIKDKMGVQLLTDEEVVVSKLFDHAISSLGQKSVEFRQKPSPHNSAIKTSPTLEAMEFFGFNNESKFVEALVGLRNKGIIYFFIGKKDKFVKVGILKYIYDSIAVNFPELGLVLREEPKRVMKIG
jgi:hypothetical protein